MCKFTVGTQKAGVGAAPPASANKTSLCTEEHMCVHGAQMHTRAHMQTDMQMAYLCQIWLQSDCWQTQSGQWVCQFNQWSLWCTNCCSSRTEDTRRSHRWTANANSVRATARSGIGVIWDRRPVSAISITCWFFIVKMQLNEFSRGFYFPCELLF